MKSFVSKSGEAWDRLFDAWNGFTKEENFRDTGNALSPFTPLHIARVQTLWGSVASWTDAPLLAVMHLSGGAIQISWHKKDCTLSVDVYEMFWDWRFYDQVSHEFTGGYCDDFGLLPVTFQVCLEALGVTP